MSLRKMTIPYSSETYLKLFDFITLSGVTWQVIDRWLEHDHWQYRLKYVSHQRVETEDKAA